jgi:hypothetical protein
MGSVFKALSKQCGHEFEASDGGRGFRFIELRCDNCGDTKSIPCPDRSVTKARLTAQTEAEWERSRKELELMDLRCQCGGESARSSPVRCPECRSTDVKTGGTVLHFD